MKFTLIRTDKTGRQRVSTREAVQFFASMKTTVKNQQKAAGGRWQVCPGAEMRRGGDGVPTLRQWNGIVVLTIDGVTTAEERERLKELAVTLPSTLAAMTTADGNGVALFVRYALHADSTGGQGSGGAAPADTTQLADHVAAAAYEEAVPAYSRALGRAVSHAEPSARMTIDMPVDASPAVNLDAVPLTSSSQGRETILLIRLLTSRYTFRYNTVMGYTEYQPRCMTNGGWLPVDDRVVNSLTMVARLSGLDAWDKDVRRYVQSNLIPAFNPVSHFLSQARRGWDGQTDHIGRLARTVPCDVHQWEQWFRKWFLYMVAQWLGVTRRYGNSVAPLLISEQGNNKSTFCRLLLPDCLQWGYNDNLIVSEKKATLQAMAQMLLINLDEFNQIGAKTQEGFLKNVIQLACVKLKRPFGRHVEDMPRLASFIATTNERNVLADPTGNRRFIGIELTAPIDVSQPIDYLGLYGQAVCLIEQGEQYWFSDDEVRQIMDHNRQFQVASPAEQYFHECFTVAGADALEACWLSAAAIYDRLRRRAGAGLAAGGLRSFGRVLANMDGLQRRRTKTGTQYWVVPLP